MRQNPPMANGDDSIRFRPLLPRLEPGPGTQSQVSAGSEASNPPVSATVSKRELARAACDPCRRRKVKCDAERPGCRSCGKAGLVCEYSTEPSETRAKSRKRKYEELQQRLADHEAIQDLLIARPTQSRDILQRLRSGDNVHSALRAVEDGNLLLQLTDSAQRRSGTASFEPVSHAAPFPPGPRAQPFQGLGFGPYLSNRQLRSRFDHPGYILEEGWRSSNDLHAERDVIVHLPNIQLPVSQWTTVPLGDQLLNHLLLLFWTWDMAGNRLIDRTMFEEDMRTLDPTNVTGQGTIFCSPFLVNALLALSCHYTMNESTFLVPNNPLTRGGAFAREAERLLLLEKDDSIPIAQGLAFMTLYEGNFGGLTKTNGYMNGFYAGYEKLRLDEKLRILEPAAPGSREERVSYALSWIDWGFYIFDWKFAVPLNRHKMILKPQSPRLWENVRKSSLTDGASLDDWWFAYPTSLSPIASLKREIFAAECALVEIIDDIVEVLTGGDIPQDDPKRGLALYRRLSNWKLSLPENLQAGNVVHPAALFLHINFDIAVMSLLRPFDDLDKETFGLIEPRSTSMLHASNAMSTLWTFRGLYTVRHEFWIVHACSVCAFRVLYDLEAGPIQVETFTRACQALYELGERFNLGRDVLNSLQLVVRRQKLRLPPPATRYVGAEMGDPVPSIMRQNVVPLSRQLGRHGEGSSGNEFQNMTIGDLVASSASESHVD